MPTPYKSPSTAPTPAVPASASACSPTRDTAPNGGENADGFAAKIETGAIGIATAQRSAFGFRMEARTLTLTLPRPGLLEIQVIDLQGRLVAAPEQVWSSERVRISLPLASGNWLVRGHFNGESFARSVSIPWTAFPSSANGRPSRLGWFLLRLDIFYPRTAHPISSQDVLRLRAH